MGRVVAETEKSIIGYFARIAFAIVSSASTGADMTMSIPLAIGDL